MNEQLFNKLKSASDGMEPLTHDGSYTLLRKAVWAYANLRDYKTAWKELDYNDLNLFLDPATFLSKVKASNDNYSFVDSVMSMPLPTYGFDYSLIRSQDIDTAYNALITYVIPNSPADQAGLKRGDWIMKVDTFYISKK